MLPIIPLTAVLLLSASLSGCTFNPFRTDNDLTGDPATTAIGAIVAGGGAYAMGASKPIIAASAVGGGLFAYYISTLRFASGGIIRGGGQVYTLGDFASVNIPTDQLFDANSSDFLNDAPFILDSAVRVLKRYPDNNILVSGNTSGFGTTRWQLQLSEARARQVSAYLWAHGVSEFQGFSIKRRHLIYTGYGNFFPIANDIRNDSNRKNSRIQITAFPSSTQLKMDHCFKVFSNIGAMDEHCLPMGDKPSYGNQFSEVIHEDSDYRNTDFKNAFSDNKP